MCMTISVTLANYNHGPFLRTCLEGILSQSYGDLQLLITDDGSTDDSRDILEEYRKQDSRVHVEFLDQTEGSMAAFQRAYTRVSGDLMYAAAADDHLSDLEFFESVVKELKRLPSVAGVFGRALVMFADGEPLGVKGKSPVEGFISRSIFLESYLRGKLLACGIASVWRVPHRLPNFLPTPGSGSTECSTVSLE